MASSKEIVQRIFQFCEKIPFSEATLEQRQLVLNDVNLARRYVYNNGDLSFKTVVKRDFTYTNQTDLTKPARGTPLPANFMGFHETGGIFVNGTTPKRKVFRYVAPHMMMDLIEGPGQTSVNTPPTTYSLFGPAEGDEDSPDYAGKNQRELVLWPTPQNAAVPLTLIYQRVPQADSTTVEDDSPTDWRKEIVPIPPQWHFTVIQPMAEMLRKLDKGANAAAKEQTLATGFKQFQVQEPHGREKPMRRPVHPAWRRRG